MNSELEQSLNLNCEHEVEFNLSTAQKYLAKLKSHQKSTTNTTPQPYGYRSSRRHQPMDLSSQYSVVDTFNVAQVNNADDYKSKVGALVSKTMDARNETRSISYDIINIKNAVHKVNSSNGIDEILSTIDFLNAELSGWRSIQKTSNNITFSGDSLILKAAFDKAISDSNNGKSPEIPCMNVSVYSEDHVTTKIKLLTEALNKLEEKRDTLNVNTKIKVKISSHSKNVLGL